MVYGMRLEDRARDSHLSLGVVYLLLSVRLTLASLNLLVPRAVPFSPPLARHASHRT